MCEGTRNHVDKEDTRIYLWKAFDFQRPRIRICESDIHCNAAYEAAPMRKLWPLYLDESRPHNFIASDSLLAHVSRPVSANLTSINSVRLVGQAPLSSAEAKVFQAIFRQAWARISILSTSARGATGRLKFEKLPIHFSLFPSSHARPYPATPPFPFYPIFIPIYL